MATTRGVTLLQLEELVNRAEKLRLQIHESGKQQVPPKSEPIRFGLQEASKLIGRSTQAIRDAEADGRLPKPEIGENGRRIGFGLADINQAREVFGTRLKRQSSDEPVVLCVQNFKGGSAKTTTCVHLAQYLAIAGLRVLLVDADSQASATMTFGYVPDLEIDLSQTLLPYLQGEQQTLEYAVRGTNWDGLSLIPANLDLYGSEYYLARYIASDNKTLNRLRSGLNRIKHEFDVVIIDPPPALGMISLSALRAADAVLVPMPAAAYDYYSTVSFLRMTLEVMQSVSQVLGPTELKFIKLLITRLDEGSELQVMLAELAPEALGKYVLPVAIRQTVGLDRAAILGRTLYEATSELVPRKTLKRGRASFDAVNAEILTLIRRCWPSHEQALRQNEGLI